MIQRGTGHPIVLVPGIQGRVEWMLPTIAALAAVGRVVSFSLAGEPGADRPYDRRVGFDDFLCQIDEVLDQSAIERATLCGVSFGGLIAMRYAARRPDRVQSLILVSTPSPDWHMNNRVRRYCRRPRLSAPLFTVEASVRFLREMTATFDTWGDRVRWSRRHARTVLSAPMSPVRAAQRAMLADAEDFVPDCHQIRCPTLLVTGEPQLDRVVPVVQTLRYAELIEGARVARLDRTGHLGTVTRPERFAEVVRGFLEANEAVAPTSRSLSHAAAGGRW